MLDQCIIFHFTRYCGSTSFSRDLSFDKSIIVMSNFYRFQLDACSDYEGRRKIRARLRDVMAENNGKFRVFEFTNRGSLGHEI